MRQTQPVELNLIQIEEDVVHAVLWDLNTITMEGYVRAMEVSLPPPVAEVVSEAAQRLRGDANVMARALGFVAWDCALRELWAEQRLSRGLDDRYAVFLSKVAGDGVLHEWAAANLSERERNTFETMLRRHTGSPFIDCPEEVMSIASVMSHLAERGAGGHQRPQFHAGRPVVPFEMFTQMMRAVGTHSYDGYVRYKGTRGRPGDWDSKNMIVSRSSLEPDACTVVTEWVGSSRCYEIVLRTAGGAQGAVEIGCMAEERQAVEPLHFNAFANLCAGYGVDGAIDALCNEAVIHGLEAREWGRPAT